MTVERMTVVDCYELEDAVKLQFGLGEEFDILRACFEMAENGSYQDLCIDELSVENARKTVERYEEWNYLPHEIEYARQLMLTLTYLHDVFPNEETILVHVSW